MTNSAGNFHPDYGAYCHKEGRPIDIAGFMLANIKMLLNNIFEGIIQTEVECRTIPGLKRGVSGGEPVQVWSGGTYETDGVQSVRGQDLIVIDVDALTRYLHDCGLFLPEQQLEILWEHVIYGVRMAMHEVCFLDDNLFALVDWTPDVGILTLRRRDVAIIIAHTMRVWRAAREAGRFNLHGILDAMSIKNGDLAPSDVLAYLLETKRKLESRMGALN